MYFKRLELNGFKSFADPVTIEFTEGITCIVGPNGSGKSNISDAIRWVLGEQSPKMLRGGKMEEVIFAGTQSRKAKGMAEVTLVIDNSDHSLPIDYAEVGITRRMYRSGESEYYINKNLCRLKDIRELIMDTGIGVEGYSIIGQGKIADIVSNKMDSRREIFEEAAGVVKYRSKKEEAERKLAAADGNLSRVNDIVNEIEGRIGGLKKESEKAAEYLEIKEKSTDVEINIILKNIEQADAKSDAVKKELQELEKLLQEKSVTKEELESDLSVKRGRAAQLDGELEALRDSLLEKIEEIHELSARDEVNKEKLAGLESAVERFGAEIGAAEEKILREEANLQQAESAEKEAQAEIESLDADFAAKHAAAETAAAEAQQRSEELEGCKNRLFEIASEISGLTASGKSIEGLKETLLRRSARLKEDAGIKDQSDRDLLNRLNAAKKEFSALEAKQKEYAAAVKEAKLALSDANAKLAAAVSDAESEKIAAGKLSARLALIDELEKSYEGYSGGVKFLMEKNVIGIIGTLGELLIVPKGLETAVETALGGKLQNIVCKNDQVASIAIGLLKENKAGRLTFLPADNLRVQPPLDVKHLKNKPGFVGLASDMVQCEGGYQHIVEYVLGNVVICRNLEDALKMSHENDGPHKFVTLDGEIINAAGALTGGSLKNNTGNLLARKAEKAELEKKIKDSRKALTAAEKAKLSAQEEIEAAEKKRAKAEESARNAELSAAMLQKEIQLADQARIDAAGAEERRLAELDDLDKEIANAEKRLADMQDRMAALEKTRAEAEAAGEQAAEACGKTEEILESAREAETTVRLQQNAAVLRLSAAGDLKKMVENGLAELRREKSEKSSALDSAKRQISQILDFSEGAGDLLAMKEEERKDTEARLDGLQTEKEALSSLCEDLEKDVKTAQQQLYEIQLKKNDADVRMARFDTQTENLKEKLWEDFEMSYAQAAEHEDPDFILSKALRESREYKDRLRALGDVNIGAIEEYRQVSERYEFLTAQKADILQAMEELRRVISNMDTIIKTRFKENFDTVVLNFEETFRDLFKGGHARLSLENPSDPMESAIEIEVQPPGKKLQNMNLLSGGEKTLTAIALMFAVLRSKPTPFCILDEIEAALDETNIETVASYIRSFAGPQFTLITHQKLTMEYADVLYGVTMPESGITQVLSLKLGEEFEV